MITKSYLIYMCLVFAGASACQGGGGEPLVSNTINDDIDFEEPPNDSDDDPDDGNPDDGNPDDGDPDDGDPDDGDPDDGDPDDGDPDDDNTPCGRTCSAWRQTGCADPDRCLAGCNTDLLGACGPELQAVVDCFLDAGVCLTEDVASTDPNVLQGCSLQLASYSACSEATP